jgi:peptidoglycan-associated lipoprotein
MEKNMTARNVARLWPVTAMLLLAVVISVPGCKKKAPKETPPPTTETEIEPVPTEVDTTGQGEKELRVQMDRDMARIMPVYFDYDRSEIVGAERDKIRTVAEVLRTWPDWTVNIEGHCDERGTNEYNLALGERRAKSAQRALVAEGIGSERISIISYGEERPSDPGHTETSWSRNRRAEFRVSTGPSTR